MFAHRSPVLPLALAQALAASLAGCTYLTEQRADPTEITWSGWVLAELEAGDLTVLDGGSVDILDLDGELLASAEMTSQTDPGYWTVDVPTATPVAVRITGPSSGEDSALPPLATTLWRGDTPTGRAIWLALFAREQALVEDMFAQLSGGVGAGPQALTDGEVAHLWGEPLYPEDWAGADIRVITSEGEEVEARRFAVGDDGMIQPAGDGPVDIFYAINLPPGPTTLRVLAPGRPTTETTWPALGGDLLSAIYFALPEASP